MSTLLIKNKLPNIFYDVLVQYNILYSILSSAKYYDCIFSLQALTKWCYEKNNLTPNI
jgi:hypothetical protein